MQVVITLNTEEMDKALTSGALQVFTDSVKGEERAPYTTGAPTMVAESAPVTPPVPAPATPVAPQTPAVPTGTQTYTLDDLSGAAAKIMTSPEMQTALIGMMQTFGVNSLGELDPSQYGDAALKLRELGAEI